MEESVVGTTILRVNAGDKNGGSNSQILYSITNDTADKFHLNITTGIIVVKSRIDREDNNLTHNSNQFVLLLFTVCARVNVSGSQSSCVQVG